MSCDPRTSKALIDTLFTSGSMGLCLFDPDGRVVSVEGSGSVWAPPPGASIEEATIFVGMSETFAELRKSGESLLLSGVSIGSDDARALDMRVLWVEPLGLFAAMSHTATERNQLQLQVSQIVRDNRLLEEKVRQQQEKIAEQAALMAIFIRHVPAAVAMVDASLEPIMLSRRWIEEFGDPALGDDPDVAGSPLRLPGIDAALRLAMDNGVTSSRVEKIASRGAVAWKRWEQTPWRRADRKVGGSILYFEDVTDDMRKTDDLRAQTAESRRLEKGVRAFGAGVTDAARPPLAQIAGATAALLAEHGDTVSSAVREGIAGIAAAASRVSGIVEALRRYLGVTTRVFTPAPFDLGDAIEAAADALREDIRAAGANILLRPTLSVSGDLETMTLMFRDLLDNALKYAGGAPNVAIECADDGDAVVVTVTDDGPGIPAHLRNLAFEPFRRLEPPGGPPGAGMGLTEARRIAELHGGSMAIDPDYDLGLRVVVTLPRDGPPAARAR